MSESEIIQALRAKVANNLHVAMPGVIESYEFKEQRASIKIAIKQLYNSDTYIDYPILSGVPVMFPSSGGASITMPVVRGDTCLVMFLDKDLRAWLLGGDNLKPKSTRTHHLSDAVAVMGLSPFTKPSKAENNTDVLLTYEGSQVRLKPQGIVNIHSAKEVNIKTENVVINCKTASVKAEESVEIECKNASVKAEESITSECKNLNVKVTEIAAVECKTANVKSSEDSNIECKNANLKAVESITAECKNIAIKSLESAAIECRDANIKAAQSANIECVNAQVKATGNIDTETPIFTQKGNMKVDGNIEITGTSLLTGKLTSKNGIENSGANLVSNGKTFETHTHYYEKVNPVVATPAGPGTATTIPALTQSPV